MSKRTEQVGDLIQQVLAEALQRDVNDPRLKLVSVTAVDVTRDLAHATVYISVLGDDAKVSAAMTALEKAAGFLRHQIAKQCDLRITPQLHFRHDTSAAYSDKMDQLIQKALAKDVKKPK